LFLSHHGKKYHLCKPFEKTERGKRGVLSFGRRSLQRERAIVGGRKEEGEKKVLLPFARKKK